MSYALENISRGANRFFTRFLAKNTITGELFTLQEQLEGYNARRVQYLYQCQDQLCIDKLTEILREIDNYDFAFDVTFF